MKRVLFVSNGHGEIAIADRIGAELLPLGDVACDHLALVGEAREAVALSDVGPRRSMPSGGIVAMGNVRNFARDVRAGLLGHTLAQWRFLRSVRGRYDAVVAVGDTFALIMAGVTRTRPTIFVGTAKSVRVAPYGPFEERVIRSADAAFVRDEETAARLREHGVPASAPGNVIVDLYQTRDCEDVDPMDGFATPVAIFPGSRATAYDDAIALAGVVRKLADSDLNVGAACSIAPSLDAQVFIDRFARAGWEVVARPDVRVPFELRSRGRTAVRAWTGPFDRLLDGAVLVLGQAGTANEAAAARGVPIVALAIEGRDGGWYRRRQQGLLDGALAIVDGDPATAASTVRTLLNDSARLEMMSRIGRERMGPSGGARRIAREVFALLRA